MSPLAVVVVPARDEEDRIGACLASLAVQAGVAPGDVQVVVVLDGCQDGTAAAVEVAARAHPWLPITMLEGPERGPGAARRFGMLAARERAPRLLCSTDADSRVARDWIAAQHAAVQGGAGAVAGKVELDAVEAAALDPDVLAARAAEARCRLQTVRGWAPEAEHHQFSGASLALTCAAHDAVGGIPEMAAHEDDALERELRAAGIRIAYPRGVRVTTSARPGGRMTRPVAAPAPGADGRPAPLVLTAPAGRRGAALRDALASAESADVVVMLPAGMRDPSGAVEALVAPLHADEQLVLVKAVPTVLHPLDDVVARPLLELHAPPLTAVRSPLAAAWAARREHLEHLVLPTDDAVDLAVLIDVWRAHALGAIGQVPVEVPEPVIADPGTLSYSLLATVGAHARPAAERPGADAANRLSGRVWPGASTPAW